ncbi:rhomboid family intramembrane serine protease [Kineosporia sp. J2-2]|uniref:Rhomboid family intramembrane serine protease n=1 Tax=Kineosporia corallincola TaxID=2835133 RepID=A0ABS5TNP0_9ACTN|nr:rhomboid family intramembrane serine protease [Kineosporia corallincola]MBT0771204.1 rhomboid family intramembrane serine protease [Kineosporia corallincola]
MSYVRCQRCERPVCPECQRAAAVGVQCVDCVRDQNKGVRTARTPFGAALTAGAQPRVTQAIIGLCVVVWLLQQISTQVTIDFSFFPPYALSEPWRLLTAAFLHSPSSPLHILFNMYALWMTGPYLEQLFGRARFIALYLVSAVGGSIGYLLLATPAYDGTWTTTTVGASGAVFGMFGAFFVVQRRLNRDATQILVLIVINFALGLFMNGIAWQAHLGGLVTGVLTAAVLAYAPRTNRTALQVTGIALVVLLLAAAYAIKLSTVPSGSGLLA